MSAPWYAGLLGFRDVGGIRTDDGRVVRRGLLFRSGTPQFLEPGAARMLLADTGIRSTIDLRLPHEIAAEGRGPFDRMGVRRRAHPFSIRARVSKESAVAPMPGDDPLVSTYLAYLEQGPAAVVSIVETLLEPDALPTLVHCTVGKDRTGVAIALLLEAIGARRDDIVDDYARAPDEVIASMARLRIMRSYGADADVYPAAAWSAPPAAMHRFLSAVDDRYGGVHPLLRAHGVDADAVARLTDRLTTPERTESSCR